MGEEGGGCGVGGPDDAGYWLGGGVGEGFLPVWIGAGVIGHYTASVVGERAVVLVEIGDDGGGGWEGVVDEAAEIGDEGGWFGVVIVEDAKLGIDVGETLYGGVDQESDEEAGCEGGGDGGDAGTEGVEYVDEGVDEECGEDGERDEEVE